MTAERLHSLFGKRSAIAATLLAAAAGLPAWSCYRHDQAVQAGFLSEVMQDSSEHVVTVTTDGVVRQGLLSRGASMPNVMLGFYNRPSQAFVVASSPQAACWYTDLQVVGGQDNLPVWQKIFGGAKYETTFANPVFSDWLTYNCAPKPAGS